MRWVRRAGSVGIVAAVLLACTQDFAIFDPKDGGNVTSGGPDASRDGTVTPTPNPNPNPNPTPTPTPTPLPDGAPRDGSGDAPFDGGGDGATCTLPAGADMCCGTNPCVNAGGQCSQKCAECNMRCTTAAQHVCCAKPGGSNVGCVATPQDC